MGTKRIKIIKIEENKNLSSDAPFSSSSLAWWLRPYCATCIG